MQYVRVLNNNAATSVKIKTGYSLEIKGKQILSVC